jgi:hypothetical protein
MIKSGKSQNLQAGIVAVIEDYRLEAENLEA